MGTLHTCVLLALLCPDCPALPDEADPYIWQATKDLAYLLELWPREGNWRPQFGYEFEWVRNNWREMYDSPEAWHASRFPTHETCFACYQWTYEFKSWLDIRCQGYPDREDLRELLGEANKRYEIWGAASMATSPHNDNRSRRLSLKRLRDLLDDRSWFTGSLPSHAPLWALQRMD